MSGVEGPQGERIAKLESRADATDKRIDGVEDRGVADRGKLWEADEETGRRLGKLERFMAGLTVLQVLGMVIYTAIVKAVADHFTGLLNSIGKH